MHKYDFGYCLESNPTNKWAYDQIKARSRVLELGPAFGVLTKHLYEEKNCLVDIVEFDSNAGEHARVFANKAVLGNDGNLNEDTWYEQLCNERYDYIIALDVLEHLKNPLPVMQKAKSLLKEDGQAVISVPNLAHNAVLACLLNNHFKYTNVGLLDNTHIHFFAYHELMELLRDAEMNVICIDGVLKPLDGSEIPVSWDDVSPMEESILKDRKYGDVYQYLIVCSPTNSSSTDVACKNLLGDGRLVEKKPTAFVIINGQVDQAIVCPIKDHTANLEFECGQYPIVEDVRIVLFQESMLLSDIKVDAKVQGKYYPLTYNWTSGVALSSDNILFSDKEKGEINFALTEKAECIRISFNHAWIDSHSVTLVENGVAALLNQHDQVSELKKSLVMIGDENKKAWAQFAQREAERNEELSKRLELEEANRIMAAEGEELRRQLEASNADRTDAWAQFAQREQQLCNAIKEQEELKRQFNVILEELEQERMLLDKYSKRIDTMNAKIFALEQSVLVRTLEKLKKI